VVANYRARGYQIAMNYVGGNEGWMAEVGSLFPDFVRIDAGLLRGRTDANRLVDAIHRYSASLLVRDVETSQDMAAAIRLGADLLKGRYIGEATEAPGSISPQAGKRGDHPGYAW
jgi:EAL domain-containing protein (putative c-di-GMP-specific phosphodiesterase class I)